MKISYTLCDRCGASIPEGNGASVHKHTDERGTYPTMYMCDSCFHEVFDGPTNEAKLKSQGKGVGL